MTYSRYTPGSWTAVLAEGFAVLLDTQGSDATALGLWAGGTTGATFVDALSVLSREGFATMPAFALAVRAGDGRTNVAVRGPVEVVAVCSEGTVTVEGLGVSTWVERVLSDVQQLRFAVAGEPTVGALPLVAGVVRAGGLVSPADEVADALAAQPVEDEVPVTSPEPDEASGSLVEPAVAEPAAVDAGVPVGEVAPVDAQAADEARAPAALEAPVVEVASELAEPELAEPEPVAPELAAPEPVEPEPVESQPAEAAVEPVLPVEPEPGEPVADGVPALDIPASPDALTADPLASQGAEPTHVDDREPVAVGAHLLADGAGNDGTAFTILSSSLADLREGLPVWGGPAVVAEPEPLPAPSRTSARLVLSTGLVVALDRPVLLGRAPQAVRVSGRELPRLVAVPSPQQDISRTHAEVRVEDDEVLVTDLDSTNGVHVLQPGRGARRLRPGEPRAIRADETIDLGDGVTFIVERGT